MATENPRFAVSDVSQNEINREDTTDEGADSKVREKGHETPEVGPTMQYLSLTNEERNQYTTSSITSNLALYEEELQKRPKISSLLSNLVN
ncbi:hypothetical protein GBAR_LOCUS9946, partial [Geodia barretti]